MSTNRILIKAWDGKILGFIDTQPNGDKIVRDFYLRILGKYNKSLDATQDFYGHIIAKGDQSSMLIGMNVNK